MGTIYGFYVQVADVEFQFDQPLCPSKSHQKLPPLHTSFLRRLNVLANLCRDGLRIGFRERRLAHPQCRRDPVLDPQTADQEIASVGCKENESKKPSDYSLLVCRG